MDREVELKLRSIETSDSNHPLELSAIYSYPNGSRALWATLTGRIQ